jgi:hypothetical protein
MSNHTVIAILVVTLCVFAAVIGYGLGEHRRTAERLAAHDTSLRRHEQQLGAHTATLHAVAEDYDPGEPTPEQRRADFRIIEGGGALSLLIITALWLRGHWRSLAAAAAAAGAASAIAVALLGHSAPLPRPHGAAPPIPLPTASIHPAAPSPTAKPTHHTRGLPPTHPLLPPPPRTRRATRAAAPSTPPQPTGPSKTTPAPTGTHPTPSPSPTRSRPSPSCLVSLSVRGILSLCA